MSIGCSKSRKAQTEYYITSKYHKRVLGLFHLEFEAKWMIILTSQSFCQEKGHEYISMDSRAVFSCEQKFER